MANERVEDGNGRCHAGESGHEILVSRRAAGTLSHRKDPPPASSSTLSEALQPTGGPARTPGSLPPDGFLAAHVLQQCKLAKAENRGRAKVRALFLLGLITSGQMRRNTRSQGYMDLDAGSGQWLFSSDGMGSS